MEEKDRKMFYNCLVLKMVMNFNAHIITSVQLQIYQRIFISLFLCKYTYRYVNITIPLPPHLLSASHFFSAVVGGEFYIFKKRSPSFLWFAHTCKAWYYRIKTGGGVKNICPFYWTYFENAPCTFAHGYCDYGYKYSKSANAHILFIKVKMWFSVAKDQ